MDVGVGNGKASVESYNFKLDANLQESGALYYKLVLQRKDLYSLIKTMCPKFGGRVIVLINCCRCRIIKFKI
jgi:hypothetical protein